MADPAELTGMRWHELALQHWCHTRFLVQDGYPIPVIFTSPLDAFSDFKQLYQVENGPFAYLFNAKDEEGKPLYQPHPAPLRYPLISIMRKGWGFRNDGNYSIHQNRRIHWVSRNSDIVRKDLSKVSVANMPMAWNYKFQLDFFCMRPDTLAVFVQRLMKQFWRSGGTPQTWIVVQYPGYFGWQYIRMTLQGDVENMTPEEVPDNEVTTFRVSCQLLIEGFEPDFNLVEYPTLWKTVLQTKIPATPDFLASTFSLTVDGRDTANSVATRRDAMPPVEN